MDLRLEDGEKGYLTVGDGSQIIVYLHKIFVRIANEEFKAAIGFSRHLGIGFNIIGRADIFDRFKIYPVRNHRNNKNILLNSRENSLHISNGVCFDESERVVEF